MNKPKYIMNQIQLKFTFHFLNIPSGNWLVSYFIPHSDLHFFLVWTLPSYLLEFRVQVMGR